MEYLKDFFGIVVFSIEDDGCLNGLWTNIANESKIMNEIAKKKKKESGITGEYNVTYIEVDEKIYKGSLKIDFVNDEENTFYLLKWKFNDGVEFFGKGFKIGKQLVVSYRGVVK